MPYITEQAQKIYFVSLLFNYKGIISSVLSLYQKTITLETKKFRLKSILLLLLVVHTTLNVFTPVLQFDPEMILQLHIIYE